MKLTYYPGCTLKTKAAALDRYARVCAEKLGITMEEIEAWQCCGGVYSTARDEIATKLSAVRALRYANERGQKLVTVCSACHNVLKQTNHAMQTDAEFCDHVNRYLTANEGPGHEYHGETTVIHYLEMLRDLVGWENVKKAVTNPLTGRKIGAYYGCLLLRPGRVMAMDDAENPRILEDLIRAIGAEPVVYPMRNECCGGYVRLEDRALAAKKSTAVLDSAQKHGAEMLVTACPLCKYNLAKADASRPVVYFTELLAEAMGVKEVTE